MRLVGGDLATHVVALLVEGLVAEVTAPLLGHDAALGGLLDREADASALQVEVDDLDPELLARRHDLLGQVDVVGGHLRDVHQALDAVAHLHEGAERHQLRDPAVDQLAHLMALGELVPRVLLGGLERQADALAAAVDVEHLDLDLVADGHDRTGMVDVLPRQFGHVDEAVHAAQVDEGAEVDDARDHAGADLAGTQVVEEVLALLLLGLLQPGSAREHDVVAVLVEFDDLGVDGGVHVGLQVAHPTQFDEGGGQEAPKADVDDQTALDNLDDGAGDDTVALLDLLDPAPGPLVLGPLLGEDEASLAVLPVDDHGLDAVTDRHDLAGVHPVADRQLTRGDDALRLVPDVQKDLVAVDPDHGSLDDLAVGHVDHGGRVGVVQGEGTEVVEDDLAGGVLAARIEGAHWGRVEGGIGGSQVGHGGFPVGWGSGIRTLLHAPRGADRKSLSTGPEKPSRGSVDTQVGRCATNRNSGCSRSGGRRA